MKQLALLQNANRRSNNLSGETPIKSPATLFYPILHLICCLISLILGFRFSRLVFFLLFSPTSYNSPPILAGTLTLNQTPANRTAEMKSSSSRVVVGRHGILIRPWPHPDPEEVMRAHRILDRVQNEQRLEYGVKNPRNLIVITPTYVRTFQALHLTGVMHSLMNVKYEVTWVVVEAGGVSNETKELIGKSGIRVLHLGFEKRMPAIWSERQRVEDEMRIFALRLVRDQKLDGIVMFADDSNMHSLELFDEVQKVSWVGAVSVGILVHSGDPDEPLQVMEKPENEESSLPVQGPACNASENLVGWHTFDTMPYADKSAVFIGDMGTVLPRKMEWAGFVLNSRLLWWEDAEKPDYIRDLDSLGDGVVDGPLSLLKDQSIVEPLGSCGRKVLLWWLRVEARADSKFPPGWVIETPLEITVAAKHTPWPDVPPELPSNLQVATTEHEHEHQQPLVNEQQHIVTKKPPKSRSRKRSSRSKKKRDPKASAETQFSSRQQHLGDN